ncbi:MAG: pyridoxal phosphate-dependent aminotransferase family protein [Ignavibacteriaceae bacterium]|nr:pyridoxal phosphate-dependent aminotransferase family protein [Ignavibacteriaceae bacterium]
MEYNGGENFDLRDVLVKSTDMSFHDRINYFDHFVSNLKKTNQFNHLRCITSAADREVEVFDKELNRSVKMLMFGSNNYLGLANHPYVKQKMEEAVRQFGAGVGGPPLLNGYTSLHRNLEEKLAQLKGKEDACIFSSGYAANVGLVTALMHSDDAVIYDAYSHASFCDGIRMSGVKSFRFAHNDIGQLRKKLSLARKENNSQIFIGVEGVYSMDGDLAPLPEVIKLCREYNAFLLLDDAHGTGMVGNTGKGSAEHFGVENDIDVTLGTFSKAFASTGGFVAASKPIINYLRFFARSYMFSASLSPVVIAGVSACIDIIEKDASIINRLRDNVAYAAAAFNRNGFNVEPQSAIIPLIVPGWMNIRKATNKIYKMGIFMNSIEFPAVPVSQQRFRISLMASHSIADIDRMVEAISTTWSDPEVKYEPAKEELSFA